MTTRSTISMIGMCLTAAAISMIGVSSALAGDVKYYPGSMCVRVFGGTPGYNYGSIRNTSTTSDMFVDCPAVHDSAAISSGYMNVTDRHYSLNVNCSLFSAYALGTKKYYNYKSKSSSGSNADAQGLSFGSVVTAPYSHYYFSCTIPRTYSGQASEIHTYSVNEVP
ncbi:hypothetical protein [Thiocystis minor]|uniref:hypothetical protein n=1 Tax=Thiocystis minor TaxID=61597 RepID=UPI00191309A7|nr:hypothetical protein [Thiocystis minor]